MPDPKPEPIPYATPTDRGGWRGWLSRRGRTSGQRMLALAAIAWIGIQCMSISWVGVPDMGYWTVRVALALFALEYLLSLFQ